ncbi:MAG: glycoside hydrolase family 3 C-terminal domain-containing protein [Deltaproteobacteria bacterium]|nr:glycoside hydrolase family 3 C-terminal domain-containing protein [Deltaproteobacteria bacterium]
MKKAGISHLSLLCLILISLLFVSCQSQVPEQAQAIKGFKAFDAKAKEILSQMTLDEKIGQMTQPEQDKVLGNAGDMQKYFIGSVLSGGDSDPTKDNSLIEWTNLYDRVQEEALKTRLMIPALYGIDAVHGHSNVLGAVMFPHNIALGCTRDPELVERIGRITAKEMRATGIHWTFAPAVTVPQDIRWGRTYEGFSEDPEIVKVLGKAMVMGLQGTDLSDPLSVVACAKHYAGDGGTEATKAPRPGFPGGDIVRMWLDQGDTKVDEATLRRIHLPGYITAIEAGVGTIMPSYSTWNGERCSGSKRLLTEILKEELGFDGFLISDYNAIRQINPMNIKESIMISINAGMDMAMEPGGYREFFDTLKTLVEEGSVPVARIDDAVTRILRVKLAMGLMDESKTHKADRALHNEFGSPEHRAVAREAVRKSVVLLKNDNKMLPLSKTGARIHVAGKNADNIGNQCGGWTIRWQGQTGDVTPGGTTVLSAVKQAVSKETEVTYSLDGTGAEGAAFGIAVVGEEPYAEGVGDKEDLSLDAQDIATINNLKNAGIPVVVIVISGRPMIVNDILPQADAIVAAFLPGTEGQGITDVLFGDFNPTGKLSFSWPRSNAELPMNINMPKEKYNPLFPIGFGLSYN